MLSCASADVKFDKIVGWTDPGLVRAVKFQLEPVTVEEKGPLFEGFVLHLLRSHGEEPKLFDDLTYWAPARAMRMEETNV